MLAGGRARRQSGDRTTSIALNSPTAPNGGEAPRSGAVGEQPPVLLAFAPCYGPHPVALAAPGLDPALAAHELVSDNVLGNQVAWRLSGRNGSGPSIDTTEAAERAVLATDLLAPYAITHSARTLFKLTVLLGARFAREASAPWLRNRRARPSCQIGRG
jgi:hypothetical protein